MTFVTVLSVGEACGFCCCTVIINRDCAVLPAAVLLLQYEQTDIFGFCFITISSRSLRFLLLALFSAVVLPVLKAYFLFQESAAEACGAYS